MRAIWSGDISFGLVNVPVKLYSATEDHDVELHQVHDKDAGRIRYQRRCEVCDEIVPYKNIERAFIDEDADETIVLTRDELASIPEDRDREISVEAFVPTDQINPMLFEKSYYLAPSGRSPKAYLLLLRTLAKTDKTAIVKFAMRQKTRLAALRVRGDVLLLQTLLWPDQIREPDFPALDEKVRISAKEMQLSAALVKSFADDFEPERFRDDYRVQLRQLIDAKQKAGDAIDTEATFGEPETQGAEVTDLMAALKQSVERSRTAKKRGAVKKPGVAKAATNKKAGTDSLSKPRSKAPSKRAS